MDGRVDAGKPSGGASEALLSLKRYLMRSYPKHGGTRPTEHCHWSEAVSIPYSFPFGQQEPREQTPWSHQVCKSRGGQLPPIESCSHCGVDWRGAHHIAFSSLLRGYIYIYIYPLIQRYTHTHTYICIFFFLKLELKFLFENEFSNSGFS